MQNVFWTSTARRQTRKTSSEASASSCSTAHCCASRARSSYGTRQTSPTRSGSKCAGTGSSRMACPSLLLQNGRVIERVVDGLFAFCDFVGSSSEGARTIDRDGVRAAVVPAAPERAIANSVAYRNADALEAVSDDLATAYAEIGANWTAWVWPDHDAPGRFVQSRGHVLDAQPAAMIRDRQG